MPEQLLNFGLTESTQRMFPPSVLQHSQHPRGCEAKRNMALNTALGPTGRSPLAFKYQEGGSINVLLKKRSFKQLLLSQKDFLLHIEEAGQARGS